MAEPDDVSEGIDLHPRQNSKIGQYTWLAVLLVRYMAPETEELK